MTHLAMGHPFYLAQFDLASEPDFIETVPSLDVEDTLTDTAVDSLLDILQLLDGGGRRDLGGEQIDEVTGCGFVDSHFLSPMKGDITHILSQTSTL